MATAATTTVIAAQHSSSYRVKFRRREFLELVDIAQPNIIYHRKRMHFFAYDGFVMYTFECDERDFSQKVIEAIEFSNYQWSE
jgi:predicted ATP-grasp superfamily ATP-dependent carboligase